MRGLSERICDSIFLNIIKVMRRFCDLVLLCMNIQQLEDEYEFAFIP